MAGTPHREWPMEAAVDVRPGSMSDLEDNERSGRHRTRPEPMEVSGVGPAAGARWGGPSVCAVRMNEDVRGGGSGAWAQALSSNSGPGAEPTTRTSGGQYVTHRWLSEQTEATLAEA